MASLRAISISSSVAGVILGPSFVGFVHSVDSTGVCLVSSHLFSILIEWDDSGKSANGVTVKRPDGVITFLSLGLAKGTECRRAGNVLTFVGCDCSVLLENVEPWNPKLGIFAAKDQYKFYLDNVLFLLNCLCIRFKNESMESVRVAPIGLLANTGEPEYLEKAAHQEWRLRMLLYLYSFITSYRRAEIHQAITAAVNIFELGGITHNFLIGLCAAMWGFGVPETPYFQEGIQQIIQKTGKQVFIAEAEVILAFQGNFSERMHRMVRAAVGGEDVQETINRVDGFSTDCILGICVGVKMICGDDDSWIAGAAAYLPKEKNVTENNAEKDSFLPRIFHHSASWRKLLNL